MTSGLQGFGSADLTTPFQYGSVADGIHHNPSLEQKLKKKYWKTKQTVIQKLHKSQDEFVVAGDADIDTKLEIAYHLRSSCHLLLQTLEKYCFRLRDMSAQELAFGEYLGAYSEREYTNAGQVMKSTGKVLELEAKARLTVLPGLQRLYQEMATFEASALSDLSISIQTLEKSRTDYRAALLWMKDVSGKLHNPDYRDQLVRFRESQAAVKEAKGRFDKLKIDLTEKIGMVNASRCNLLSRSLPTYQKAMLAFSDSAAAEFYRVLVDLRSHHHHQYKLHSDMVQIRDLEAQESFILDEEGTSSSPLPLQSSDDSLLDLTRSVNQDKRAEVGKEASEEGIKEGMLVPISPQNTGSTSGGGMVAKQQAAVKHDLPLSGVEADLRDLQNELLQEFGSSSPPSDSALMSGSGMMKGSGGKETGVSSDALRSASMDLNDLLGMGLGLEGEGGTKGTDFGPMISSDDGSDEVKGREGEGGGSDVLADQWNNFSSFMNTTRTPTKTSLSEWEKEFNTQPSPSNDDPFHDLDPLNAARKQQQTTTTGWSGATLSMEPSSLADDILSLDLSTPPTTMPSQLSLVPSSLPPPSLTPQQSSGAVGGAIGGANSQSPGTSSRGSATNKESEKKEVSWVNIFAHLDPLSNEKV